MAQGSSTMSTITLGLLLILALSCMTTVVHGAQWFVGDAKGWSFGVSDWPSGKQFHAGDVLEFSYDQKIHNVVAVDEDAYNKCQVPVGGGTPYNSGDDHITLNPGKSFFMCSIPGHCQQGMKIAVEAIPA
ncbi:hypothetical protein ACP4OV_010038 [Aristida adscensionis]